MRTSSLVALALSWASATAAQQALVVQPGRTYPAGARLQAPLAGIAFELPEGFQAEWDPEVQGLLIGASDGSMPGAVWGWSEATVEEVEGGVAQLLANAGIRLEPRGEHEVTEAGSTGFFNAMTDEGPGLLRGAVRAGPHGNAFAVAALGQPDAEQDLVRVVDDVVASLSWSPPGAAGWRAQVEGTVLSASASGSDYSSGGGAPGSGASQSSTTLALCGGMRYSYESVSETYISIPGASASSESRDAHAGSWWLVADLAGGAGLWLEADDGQVFQWTVQEEGDGFLVDGTRYVVSGGC